MILLVFCTWKRGAKIYILVIVTRKNVGIETEKREIDEGILNVKIACSRGEGEKKKDSGKYERSQLVEFAEYNNCMECSSILSIWLSIYRDDEL